METIRFLVRGNMLEEVKKLKHTQEKDMAILGSGSIMTQLAEHDLIDQYIFMVDPIILGEGTPIFKGISHKLNLKLTETSTFKNGIVLLTYQPIRE